MNNEALAKSYVANLLEEIGRGFHPDTSICDYTPTFKNEKELQAQLDFAHEHLDDIYLYTLDLYMKKFEESNLRGDIA